MGQEQAEEVLVGGPEGPRLRERLSQRWPQRDAVVIALLLGIGIGVFGTHVWQNRSGGSEGQPDIHLAATLSRAYRYHEQAVAMLVIYNLDADDLVTLHGVELRVAGLRVIGDAWDSVPGPPVAVLANDSYDVVTQLRMDCSEDIGRFGQVVFSAAEDDESPERVKDLDTPVPRALRNIHEDICSSDARLPDRSGLLPHPPDLQAPGVRVSSIRWPIRVRDEPSHGVVRHQGLESRTH
jgi:hypothetical protein